MADWRRGPIRELSLKRLTTIGLAPLGITPDEIDWGHLFALAHPREHVARLEKYRLELEPKKQRLKKHDHRR